jgi:hypothetical protein
MKRSRKRIGEGGMAVLETRMAFIPENSLRMDCAQDVPGSMKGTVFKSEQWAEINWLKGSADR